MKQLIVMIASAMLGLAVFGMIAGPSDSIYSSSKEYWGKEAQKLDIELEPALLLK